MRMPTTANFEQLREQLRIVIEQRDTIEADRDKWEARAVALFWSGSVDDATAGEIRKATAEYQEWKNARRTQSDRGAKP